MQRVSKGRSILLRYGLSLVSPAVAVGVRATLTGVIGPQLAPFALVTVAVMMISWLAGTGPAAVATTIGLLLVDKYFLPAPTGVQNDSNIIHIATYLFVSGAMIFMSAAYRRSSSKYSAELRRSEAVSRELLLERDALREAEEKFRAVAETASSVILIHDGSRIRYVNRASEGCFGYDRSDMLTKDMWEIVHPAERQLLRERAAARLRGEPAPTRYEFRIITKSGEERWLDTGAALISFEGRPCFLMNAFDVTDRRRTEEALRTSEEHYRAAIEAGKVGTWDWDIPQNRVTFSQNWYSLTATLDRKYEFAGSGQTLPYMDFALWRDSIHEDDRPMVDAAIQSALENDTRYNAEFRVRQKGTNDVRWLAGLGHFLKDASGNPVRMIGAAVDVTERRRTGEALRNAEKLAATARLAASIAHEINNPLEAVTNLIFLARTTGVVNAEGEALLATADQELRRVAHLTKQALGFYSDSTFPSSFNVADVIDDVLSLYTRRLEARGVRVKKEYSESGAMYGMVEEIRQVISNLVANAMDAMSSSGGTLIIRLRRTLCPQTGSAARITVADTGVGIPVGLQKQIFEPFFTTKPATGTGLGLWLTKSIVEKHHGTIRVSSSTGRKSGSVFVVTLPLTRQQWSDWGNSPSEFQEQIMNTEVIKNPIARAAIDALQKGDKQAWHALFADGAELFDDGQPRDLKQFSGEALGHERFRSIDQIKDGGLSVEGDFHSDRWGEFRTYFRFTLNPSGKITRLDIGQAS